MYCFQFIFSVTIHFNWRKNVLKIKDTLIVNKPPCDLDTYFFYHEKTILFMNGQDVGNNVTSLFE